MWHKPAMWQIGGLAALGLGLRVWALVAAQRLSADEAIPGLMARHILLDGERPVFYWGQAYFGALEAYLVAALFGILGFHPWLLFGSALLASLTLIPLTWSLGEQLGPSPAGLIAALPVAVTPAVQARLLVNAGGGFALGAALQMASLVLVLRAMRASRPDFWMLALASLAGGAAAWVWQPALLTLPLLLIVLLASVGEFRSPRGLACVTPAVLALLPMLVYNVDSDWPTIVAVTSKFDQQSPPADGLFGQVQLLVRTVLTALGGGDEGFDGANAVQAVVLAAALVLGPLIIVAIGIRSRGLPRQRSVCAALVVLAIAPGLVVAHGGARYLFVTFVAACALAGASFGLLLQRAPRTGPLVLVLFLLACVAPNLAGYAHVEDLLVPDQLSRLDQTDAVVDALEQRGLTRGYTDYWTAYPITYVSGERVIAAPSLPMLYSGRLDRFPAYTARVDAIATPSRLFLLVDQRCSAQAYITSLQVSGATYRSDLVGRWVLIWDIQPRPGADALTLDSLHASVAAQRTC
jgi:hypothetical protein